MTHLPRAERGNQRVRSRTTYEQLVQGRVLRSATMLGLREWAGVLFFPGPVLQKMWRRKRMAASGRLLRIPVGTHPANGQNRGYNDGTDEPIESRRAKVKGLQDCYRNHNCEERIRRPKIMPCQAFLVERHRDGLIQWLSEKVGSGRRARAWTMPPLGEHKIAFPRPPFAAFHPCQLRLQSNARSGESGIAPAAGFGSH